MITSKAILGCVSLLVVIMAGLLVSPSSASASTISINFRGDGDSTYQLAPSDVAGVVPASNWNDVTGTSGTGIALKNGAGSNSGASLAFDAGDNGVIAGPSGNDQKMMFSYIHEGASATVSSLSLADPYDVYVYFWDEDSKNLPEDITLTSSSYTKTFYVKEETTPYPGYVRAYNTVAPPVGTRDAGTYVVFTGVTGSSFTVDTGGEELNGIQITPEPATLSLLALGGLALLRRRNK